MTTRRDFLKSACAYTLCASPWTACTSLTEGPGARPNIVFFFVDDMGWQDTSVPFHTRITALNERYRTPNMERLAARGMKFTQSYACAVCSPSRVSLMTGLNAARHQVTNWTLRKNKSPDREHPKVVPPKWNVNGLSPRPGVDGTVHATTLPMLLRKAGYRTIHAGKAHFGARGTPGENPLNLGFDVNIAGHAAGGPGSYHGTKNFSAAWRKGGRIWDVPGLEPYHGREINLTEALTIEANRAVDQAVADGKPFYLYMSHYAIHAPWEKDERYYEKYRAAGLDDFDATYASMLQGMDRSLGDIVANVKRQGIEDSTIFVFMSDNGQPSQADRNEPLRGHKLTPYEGGVRVPMIVKWPGVTEPGSECADTVIIEDIFPSFLEMAGMGNGCRAGEKIDGVSFVPLLKRTGGYPTDRALFWHYPHTYDQPPYSSVRQGDWKLIYHHVDRQLELFNVKVDIGEQNNLASLRPEKTAELAGILSDHLRETGAGMPIDKATGKSIEYPDALPAGKG
jgi:arylsulfatase A-like enzyme